MQGQSDNPKEQVIRADGRYPLEAYAILEEGLLRAVQQKYGEEGEGPAGQRHVSGKDLCLTIRQVALDRYGMLAKAVLARWNVHESLDFGNMVYLLIEHDFMRRTDEDSLEDFRDVFDFDRDLVPGEDFELKE